MGEPWTDRLPVRAPAALWRRIGRLHALRGWRSKNWDEHVAELGEMAASPGFRALRDRILELAEPRGDERMLDVGAGAGLLALALAPATEHVWALDVSSAMCRHLEGRAAALRLDNLDVIRASATSLPLASASLDLAVSNYCFHHLEDSDKDRALAELGRVLKPSGRLVFADMMFRVGVVDKRNRAVIASLLGRLLRRGPAGILLIAKNAFRYLTGSWEQSAEVAWWDEALKRAGFTDEGGIACARRPAAPHPADGATARPSPD